MKKGYKSSFLAMVLALAMVLSGIPGTATVARAAEDTASQITITLDGNTEDWTGVKRLAVNENGFAQIAAFTTDDALYILRELSDVNGYAKEEIYLDVDGNNINGYAGRGIDYLIQGGSLYEYTGLAGGWGWDNEVEYESFISEDGSIAEIRIPFTQLKFCEGYIRINIGTIKSDWSTFHRYPSSSSQLIDVPTLAAATGSQGEQPGEGEGEGESGEKVCIVLDGETNDWDHIAKFAEDQGGFSQVAAFVTSDALYIMRDLSDTTDYYMEEMYIDADGNGTGGYLGLGIDFLIQGANLYEYTGIAGGWGWGHERTYESFITADKSVGEFRIPLIDLNNSKGDIRINIGTIRTDWYGLHRYPAVSTSLAEVPRYEDVYVESDAEVITAFDFVPAEDTRAITANTMRGGVIGTFNAEGGDGENYRFFFAGSDEFGTDNSRFAIEGNKLVVKDELLSPGDYKIFAKVSSDIRSMKRAFVVHVDEADGSVGIDETIFRGELGQWFTVAHDEFANAGSTLYATRNSERLITMVNRPAGDLDMVNIYYINVNDNTGYSISGYNKIDYVVRDAKLFKLTADETMGEPIDDVWVNPYADRVEMQMYLSQIGNPSQIKIAWRGISGTAVVPAYESGADSNLVETTAKYDVKRDNGYVYPAEDFASFANPYKGWVSWAIRSDEEPSEESYFDYNTVYFGISWRDLEPTKGVYDWDGVEEKFHLSDWAAKGVRVNLRFLMDNPAELEEGQETRMDIPDWLYEELLGEVEAGRIDSVGTFYNEPVNLGGAGLSPNYESELLQKYHMEAIKALAERFDDNSITAFVQIGSLGHWGEFHTWPEGSGDFPNPTTCNKYMEAYTKYFKNVKLGLRKSYPYAAENNFGLFNDVFGVSEYAATYTYLDYVINGDTDMPGATSEEVLASVMPDFWKVNYSGGEFASGDVTLHVTTKGTIGCLQQLRDTHVSWLGPCSAADMNVANLNSYLLESNVLAMQKLMGYNFTLSKINEVSEAKAGESFALNMIWTNQGTAPFYYEWPLEFSLINASGEVVAKTVVDGNITEWLPGRTAVNAKVDVPADLAAGTYTLAVAVLDKDTLEPGMRLAIAGGRDDLRYGLYDITVEAAPVEKFTGFKSDRTGTYYYEDDQLVTGWKEIDGFYYYFMPADGKMICNRYKIVSGVGYTFDAFGHLSEGGWTHYAKGSRYYWAGQMATGWTEINGATYYFDANGYMAKGTVMIDGVANIFTEAGVYVSTQAEYTGFITTKAGTYYYVKGEQISGWMHLNMAGQPVAAEEEGAYYYFNPSDGGRMRTQDKIVAGAYYYISDDGRSDGYGTIVNKKATRIYLVGELLTNTEVTVKGVTYTVDAKGYAVAKEVQ